MYARYAGTQNTSPVVAKTENKTEILEAVKLCAKANASISISYSPYALWWGSSSLYCPTPHFCDPTIRGVGEELELRFFRTRLTHIVEWMAEANTALGSAVQIGGVLLDMEQFLINWSKFLNPDACEKMLADPKAREPSPARKNTS